MKNKVSKIILIFWCLFIGIGAVAGSIGMFVDPSGGVLGFDALMQYFQVLPFADVLFQDLIFSGIALLIVNGITNITASILLFFNKKIGIILGMTFGITLMLWICIQFWIFPFNFMSTIYFVFGLLQAITGYICLVRYNQSIFHFDKTEYPNITKTSKTLVVYFSRTGYTQKIAYETANTQKSDIIEVKTSERISGNLGFLWCGRFGMHRWGMPIDSKDIDISNYEKIIICSPVWVFGVCAPIREFCKVYANKITNVEYIFTHFMRAKLTSVADEMDKTLNTKRNKATSLCVRFGKIKKTYNI